MTTREDIRASMKMYLASEILPLATEAVRNNWDIADTLKNESALVKSIMENTDAWQEVQKEYHRDYMFRDAAKDLRYEVEKELERLGEQLQEVIDRLD